MDKIICYQYHNKINNLNTINNQTILIIQILLKNNMQKLFSIHVFNKTIILAIQCKLVIIYYKVI